MVEKKEKTAKKNRAAKTKKAKKPAYVYGRGRRRTAKARVRVYLTGDRKGQTEVNGLPVEKYFPGELSKKTYLEPLRTCNVVGKYFVSAKIVGSGKSGQLGAFVHGLLDLENFRPILKKRGFLTRDPRMKERRKVGTGGKARRQKQSPKR
jgi:small subunit ribosomal protein S9